VTAPRTPSDWQAERALIGSCLLDPQAVAATAWLPPEAFDVPRNGVVWQAVLACHARGVPTDISTVASQLIADSAYDTAGGFALLMQYTDDTPLAYHPEHYAQAVERAWRYRRLIEAGARIAALGYGGGDDYEAAQAEAERELLALNASAAGGDFTPAAALADRVLAFLDGDEPPALSTGLADLDRKLIGWRPGRLYVVAARPGMGKTGFALSTAAAACQAGARVAIYSLEMAGEELLIRLAAGLSGVDSQRVEGRALNEREYAAVVDALAAVHRWPLVVSEDPDDTIARIRAKARRAHAQRPLDLVIVDYLQLAEGSGETRSAQVGDVARGLKKLARELGVPVIAPAQLNREVEGRASKVPMLSDLRESGEIEQAADVVAFLYRPEYYDATDKPGIGEIHIAKQRGGPTGVVSAAFHGPSTMWRDLSHYDAPGGY
jgi:replicative DNA helicase